MALRTPHRRPVSQPLAIASPNERFLKPHEHTLVQRHIPLLEYYRHLNHLCGLYDMDVWRRE